MAHSVKRACDSCSRGSEFEPHVGHRAYFQKGKSGGKKIRHLLYNQVLAHDFRDSAFLPGLMRKG